MVLPYISSPRSLNSEFGPWLRANDPTFEEGVPKAVPLSSAISGQLADCRDEDVPEVCHRLGQLSVSVVPPLPAGRGMHLSEKTPTSKERFLAIHDAHLESNRLPTSKKAKDVFASVPTAEIGKDQSLWN